MGFGNFVNFDMFVKKFKKVYYDEKKEKKDKFEDKNVFVELSKIVVIVKVFLVWFYKFFF